ncbi:MAG: PhnD/SsuA/transferrin family substrate-binding protein [Anaerolineaceae bacterium]|nr:PhnD/SsuA/transferrin family substrate-binding protein [Anaerolineaceae bacterium]
MKKPNIKHLAFTLLLIALVISVTGCKGATATEEPASVPTEVALLATELEATSTPRPTPTPTEAPLGQAANPIIMGFVIQPEQTAAIDAAQEIISLISSDTNLAVQSAIYPDFLSLSTAILDGDVDLFWLDPLEYIYLNSQGAADVILVSNHLGVYAYGVRFLANNNRGFTNYYDADLDESYGDTLSALQQFAGTRPCFINDQSLPGYFAPLGLLNNTSTPTLDPVFVYDYSAVIRALYIGGICDFGISYALIGDARTASDVQWDLPDAESVISVVWQSEGIIPNLNLSVSPLLPLTLQVQLQEAILDLADAPEGLTRLSTALNYDISALKAETDSFYTPLRSFLAPLGLDYQSLTQEN